MVPPAKSNPAKMNPNTDYGEYLFYVPYATYERKDFVGVRLKQGNTLTVITKPSGVIFL